jgi:tetratricopeptide (TPR) repeat protein
MLRKLFKHLRGNPVPEDEAPAPVRPETQAGASVMQEYEAGLAAFRAKQWEVAAACFGRVLEGQYDLAEAHFYLGLSQRKLGALEDASDSLLLATTFKPALQPAHFYLGVVALERKQLDDAQACFDRALALRPDDAQVFNSLGKLNLVRGDVDAAIAHYRHALALKPGFAAATSNLAYVLFNEKRDAGAALALAEEAVRLAPAMTDARCNLAMVLQFLGRCEEALEATAVALQADPTHDKSLLNRSMALLMLEDYAQGWPAYEARRTIYPSFRFAQYALPEWDGSDPGGRTVLVYAEQGLGDEIMFASCLPDLLKAAKHVVIECEPKLVALMHTSFPDAYVKGMPQISREVSWLPEAPHAPDCKIAIGSLPLHFRKSRADFPTRRSYLTADPERRARWRERLDALGPGRKIGISWRGGTHYTNAASRQAELAAWAPVLARSDAHFISLQYTDCAAEIAVAETQQGFRLHHWPDAIDDYADTAALVAELDLVISVCTAVIHLAGALGTPTWILVHATPDWRYLRDAPAMPWYPSVDLLRQGTAGDWTELLGRVARRLDTPASADALVDAAVRAAQAGDLAQARRQAEAARAAGADSASFHMLCGNLHRQDGATTRAIEAYRAALAKDADAWPALINLGASLRERGELAEATTVLQHAMALQPAAADSRYYGGLLAADEGRSADALRELDAALAADPDFAEAHVQRGFLLLAQQRYAEGWPGYAWRYRTLDWRLRHVDLQRPWSGEPLPEATLLVRAEQGLGDQIMFMSCLAEAAARVGRVILECDARLAPLAARAFSGWQILPSSGRREDAARLLPGGLPADAVDTYLGCLPQFFRVAATDFPGGRAYLAADRERVRAWREKLAASSRPLIGIVWRGGTPGTRTQTRSLRLAELLAALPPHATLISLQWDATDAECRDAERVTGRTLLRCVDAARDIDDTAALLCALDRVVTVCGSVVHLAGALGVPAEVLVPAVPEWRYLDSGDRMPWYASVRLLRQRAAGDWSLPLAALHATTPG